MYMFDQRVANKIAATQLMATEEMKLYFEANELQAKEKSKEWEKAVLKQTNDPQIACAVAAFFPILAEHEAITCFINSTADYTLRIQIPEIITAEEAGLFAQMEFSLNKDQTYTVVRLIEEECAGLSSIPGKTEDMIGY